MQLWKPTDKVGQEDDPYIIEKIIGSGGFGVTYLARKKSGKLVVIKTLNPQQQIEDNFKEAQKKLAAEAVELAGLNHLYIVKVYGSMNHEGLVGIVMEYIDGDNLSKYIKEQGILSENDAIKYIKQIGSALEYIHKEGIIHRDVKPGNIVLEKNTQKAILIDFGLAREFNADITESMTSDKTHGYAPPEQYYQRGRFDPLIDVYALAATLYTLLTGEIPIPSKFREHDVPFSEPKQFNSKISQKVNDAILQGMALNPQKRPKDIPSWISLLETTNVVTVPDSDHHTSPKTEPDNKQPKPQSPKPQPINTQPKPQPVNNQPKPQPINTQPKPQPVNNQPKPQPVNNQPKPQPKPISQKQKNTTRRDFIQTVSLVVGGAVIAVVGQNLFSTNKNQTSTPKITTPPNTPTPTPEITTSPNTPTPTPENTTSPNTPTPEPTPKITTPPLQTFNFEVVTTDATGSITNRRNASAKYFTEDLGNGVLLEMVEIPGGTFMMGSPESEAQRSSNESPQHQVTVPSFYMGKYELTQAQYQAIMGSNPAHFKGDKRPVEKVSWDDAVAFCQKLSQRTGKKYRLPSEAEWEYACRAGTTTPFYFGESITPELVNYDGSSSYASAPTGQYRGQTTDVGTFSPNAFGLYDMHGNVWEWCQDDYQENYINAPTDGSALTIPNAHYNKLLRGGSWINDPWYCRSAPRFRHWHFNWSSSLGFRLAISPSRTL